MDVGRDIPVLKMSLGAISLIKAGAHVFVGAQKNASDELEMVFVFVGEDGIVPPM